MPNYLLIIWINLDKASEDTTEDKLIIESDKEVANSQTGETPLSEEDSELLLISIQSECPWPPALCGNGGQFGEPP